ncbi:MAG: NAD(P)H-hydrate dehydratase [Oscillospiraceae bacterium]|nr:NAD(P)H-hydrate dehydratase [Oscillospiraceae bacterium]
MKLADSAQMKALDAHAIQDLGIPSTLLMQHAADGLLAAVDRAPSGPVVILCGSGNNGGDGLCAAAGLLLRARPVRVFFVTDPARLTPDAREMLRRLEELGGTTELYTDAPDAGRCVSSAAVVIDAMLGTGLNAPLRGSVRTAVQAVNASSAYVIAADMPTGVSADTGEILGDAVRADETVTFSLPKIGQFTEPGCTCCGRITVWDIGIPPEALEAVSCPVASVDRNDLTLPTRDPLAHKGSFGRDLILAGSIGYTGAPVMAAEAALRTGAGLVYLGVPDPIYSIVAIKCTEVMPQPVPCDDDGIIGWKAKDYLRGMLRTCQCVLAGPGLGRGYELTSLIELLIRESEIPVVLDADALNAIASDPSVLKEAKAPVIITPHPGEFARLGGSAEHGRLAGALAFAREYGCIVVLKGHRTVTALPDGRAFLNTTGGPAMAKAGSGDVLAGMIAALLGQGLDPWRAAVTAVWLHGRAGDLCAEALGEYSVTASDLISAIPPAMKTLL